MSYVLTDGGLAVVKYPYSPLQLRRESLNVSFPATLSDAQLAEWNVYPVTPTAQPAYDPIDETITELPPIYSEGEWVQRWTVSQASAEQAAASQASFEASAKAQATALLRASDVFVIESVELSRPVHPDLTAYRAALRSPETLPGYPVAPVFPELPQNVLADPVDLPADFDNSI